MERILYTLMNKDRPLCDFEITGEGEMEICSIVKQHDEIPFWAKDVDTWVHARSAAARQRAGSSPLPIAFP